MTNIIDNLLSVIQKVKNLEANQKKKPGAKKKMPQHFTSSGCIGNYSFNPSDELRWMVRDVEILYKEIIALQKKKLRAKKVK